MYNFTVVVELIKDVYRELGVIYRKDSFSEEIWRDKVERLVKKQDLDELERLLELSFEIVIRNLEAVEFITSLSEEQQESIEKFLKIAKSKHFPSLSLT